jgi:hypothetical protein
MISYTPAFVSLGLIRPGQVVSRVSGAHEPRSRFKLGEPKVVIQGREGGEWDLANRFSTDRPGRRARTRSRSSCASTAMPRTLNGSFSGTLDIQVGHPEKPEIKLPITGVCRGAAVGRGRPAPLQSGPHPARPADAAEGKPTLASGLRLEQLAPRLVARGEPPF